MGNQVEFKVSATGVSGIASQAFGIDDIDVDIDVVAAQVFTSSLPFTVSNGAPAAGSGNLESAAAEDDYQFTLASGGGVLWT